MWAGIIFIILGAIGVYAFGIQKKEDFNTRRLRLMTKLIGAKGTRYFLLGMSGIMLFAGTASLVKPLLSSTPKKTVVAVDTAPEPHKKSTDTAVEFHLLDSAMALMNNRKYQESMNIFLMMVDSFPESRGFYLGLVGTDYALQKKYDTSIEYFVKARDNGDDTSRVDDNIWLASKASYRQDKDLAHIKKYLTLCPSGNHLKEAKKFMGKK